MEWYDVLMDALADTRSLIPLLFLTYVLVEYLERHMSRRTVAAIGRAGRFGPVIGSLLGVVPQCGFSAAVAGLYARRIVTTGALLAVFLSTSDEMLPILIASRMPMGMIVKILAIKALWGLLAGFCADALLRLFKAKGRGHEETHDDWLTQPAQCSCSSHSTGSLLLTALWRTVQVGAAIFLITLVLNAVITKVGIGGMQLPLINVPVIGEMIAALIGLIPNCAVSVGIATLYVDGACPAGAAMAGLFSGSGVGLLMLFGANRGHMVENVAIVGMLWVFGVLGGVLVNVLNLL